MTAIGWGNKNINEGHACIIQPGERQGGRLPLKRRTKTEQYHNHAAEITGRSPLVASQLSALPLFVQSQAVSKSKFSLYMTSH